MWTISDQINYLAITLDAYRSKALMLKFIIGHDPELLNSHPYNLDP